MTGEVVSLEDEEAIPAAPVNIPHNANQDQVLLEDAEEEDGDDMEDDVFVANNIDPNEDREAVAL